MLKSHENCAIFHPVLGIYFTCLESFDLKDPNNQEMVQSESNSHSKNRSGEKTKLTIRYLYKENRS